MEQPIDRRADINIQRIQPYLCLPSEYAMEDLWRLLELVVGFAVVSVLWGVVLFTFVHSL